MSSKILVVDDDPAARMMLTRLLGTIWEVLEASAGKEALRIMEAERPRLMLLDMTMPGMSGLEVLAIAHAAVPAMTIIMLTGASDIELAKRALELGAAEYVTKPFDLSRLKDKVKRTMETFPNVNAQGHPWRIVAPESAAVSDWEGEGGGLAAGEKSKEIK